MKKEHMFIRRIYPSTTIVRIEKKINLLGCGNECSVERFLFQRFLLSLLIFLSIFFFFRSGFLIAPVLTLLIYFSFEYFYFDKKLKARGKRLEEDAIFFFEVLSLTLESGRTLNNALSITSKNINSELSKEFRNSLEEMKLGKSFIEVLNDMKERIPSETINHTLLNITQSSLYGNDITNSLNDQLDFLREKRLLEVKAEISKLPTKISVLSVVFFVPIMILVILSPIILELLFG